MGLSAALLVRLGYAGLALLGYSRGVAAKQKAIPSAARVAFAQHGVVEAEDIEMHIPKSSQKAAFPMTPSLLSTAIARLMSIDGAKAELEFDLPAGDMFDRPDGNILVLVDGLQRRGCQSAPFMTEWLQHPWYNLRTPTEDSFTSALESILCASFDVAQASGSKSSMLCASVDSALANTDTCMSAQWVLSLEEARSMVWDERATFGPGLEVDMSSGLRTLRLTGGQRDERGAVILDLSVEADLLLVQELCLLTLLPKALEGSFEKHSSPPLVVVYLSSLEAIRDTYGESSTKGSLAFKAIDASLAECIHILSTASERRLTSQLVAGPHLKEKLAYGGRRLQTENTTTSTTSNVSLADISQFQLNVWTGVFLFILGFLAIYTLVTMDVQPDSLLYAKFITDTSGSGLKTD